MKNTHLLVATALIAGLALSSSACEVTAKSSETYKGTPVEDSLEWTAGQDLFIEGRNGEVTIVEGNPGSITVRFEPFTIRGYDEDEEARDEMENSLVTSIAYTEDDGGIFIETRKDGPGSSSLGAHIEVAIPPDFDSGIFVEQGAGGDVEMLGVGNAVELGVEAFGISDCRIQGSPTVVKSQIWCGAVDLKNVSGHVNVQADFLDGNASVSMASVLPAPAENNIIYTEDGDIVLSLPAAEDHIVMARATSGGVVGTGSPPDRCDVSEADESSKTVTCGAGPTFELEAGLDAVGEAPNIELQYR